MKALRLAMLMGATALAGGCSATVPSTLLTTVPAGQGTAPAAAHKSCGMLWNREDVAVVRDAIAKRVASLRTRLEADQAVTHILMKPVLDAVEHRLANGKEPASLTITWSNVEDIKQEIHDELLTLGHAPPAAAETATDPKDDPLYLFEDALGYYFTRLFEGTYVDRFGTKVSAPTLSTSISDSEMQNVLAVFIDVVMDFVVRAPVWQDPAHPGVYYPTAFATGASPTSQPAAAAAPKPAAPGGKATPAVKPAAAAPAPGAPSGDTSGGNAKPLIPTAIGFSTDATMADHHNDIKNKLWAPILNLDGTQSSESCQMDETKLEVANTLAQLAKVKAAGVTGITLGSVGGFGFSAGVFGKVSIGDNKTLEALVQTVLSKAAQRIVFELSTRAVYEIDDRNRTIGNILSGIHMAANDAAPGSAAQ
jgi:hypothetical protein